jgi:hypothetical protein
MARKPSQYIELSGGLFEPGMVEGLYEAIGAGVKQIAEDFAVPVMMGFIEQGGFVKTRSLLLSVDSDFKQGDGRIGYAKVAPTDVWPKPKRPTRTWIARGERGGQKLRPGFNIFSRTATRVKQQNFEHEIADRIARLLE